MTCYNRRDKTLACLNRLLSVPESVLLRVYLLDDGSSDDTGAAVREFFPQVKVFEGDGSNYWSGGMRLLFQQALKEDFAAYIWLNDDVVLDPDALSQMMYWFVQAEGKAILGGAMREPNGKRISYGGSSRSRFHPLRTVAVIPDPESPLKVDLLHGNFFVVPRLVATRVGGICEDLIHLGGDYDYCLRARKMGLEVLLLPGTYGVCESNPSAPRLRGISGLRRILSAKALPLRSHAYLCRQMAGPTWPFWLISTYVKAFLFGN